VAIIKEENSNDCDIIVGTTSTGKIIPINNDFEKSGLGNNRSPPIKPMIIDK
tara:strand:+ start:440 stop:595 length:156 start_codon:yes stop_codon:yes gene_type:complete